MSDWQRKINLAHERLGTSIVYANDEFFAEKENLLRTAAPVFIEGKYTDRGKWMDGWETRRRREPGNDFCIVRLGVPGIVGGVCVDTSHFRGNFPEQASIEVTRASALATAEELLDPSVEWIPIAPKTRLEGHSKNLLPAAREAYATHLRLQIYPDGGVARLHVHGDAIPHRRWMGEPDAVVDVAAAENGGDVIACNDMFFGSRHNLIMPGRGVNMGDGWETRRSRKTAPDWAIVRLAAESTISEIEIDTRHFKGNFPESFSVCGVRLDEADARRLETDDELVSSDLDWRPVVDRTRLQADTRHVFAAGLDDFEGFHSPDEVGPVTHLRLRIYPDGGVSRMRVRGRVTEAGRITVSLRQANLLRAAELAKELSSACASSAWAKRVAQHAPFSSLDALKDTAKRVWLELDPRDREEAYAAHPRIGQAKPAALASGQSAAWSKKEQSGMAAATATEAETMRELNAQYEKKFGQVYLVCATGKSPTELLQDCRSRLAGTKESEIERMAEEQAKITELRLERWLME